MKINDVINKLNTCDKKGSKLETVKLINDIRGGGLLRSKEIADKYFRSVNNYGKFVIEHLREHEDWKLIKSNIRKLKDD